MMRKMGGGSSSPLSGAELGCECYAAMTGPLKKNQGGEMDTDHIQP
jgi:hypothetical protein